MGVRYGQSVHENQCVRVLGSALVEGRVVAGESHGRPRSGKESNGLNAEMGVGE